MGDLEEANSQPASSAFARAARRRATTTRQMIFGMPDVLMPVSEPVDAITAAPGLVGSHYRSGGVLILSVNPAGGKDDRVSSSDDHFMYAAFRELASASDAELESKFKILNQIIVEQMPSWGVYKRYTAPILKALDLELAEIAYIYAVPFRTRGDHGAKIAPEIVDRAYDTGLGQQLSVLAPSMIIPIDRHSERMTHRYVASCETPPEFQYFTRQRSDHTGRRATLAKLSAWSARRSS